MEKTRITQKHIDLIQPCLQAEDAFKESVTFLYANVVQPNSDRLLSLVLLDMQKAMHTSQRNPTTLFDYGAAVIDTYYGNGSHESERYTVKKTPKSEEYFSGDSFDMFDTAFQNVVDKGDAYSAILDELFVTSPAVGRHLVGDIIDRHADIMLGIKNFQAAWLVDEFTIGHSPDMSGARPVINLDVLNESLKAIADLPNLFPDDLALSLDEKLKIVSDKLSDKSTTSHRRIKP
jgi:hypothetical protein